MDSIAESPGAQRLFAASIIARSPLAMLSIGLLVHARQLTGSFAPAGVVSGAYAIALGKPLYGVNHLAAHIAVENVVAAPDTAITTTTAPRRRAPFCIAATPRPIASRPHAGP